MIDPGKVVDDGEAMDRYVAGLRADNKRQADLIEALLAFYDDCKDDEDNLPELVERVEALISPSEGEVCGKELVSGASCLFSTKHDGPCADGILHRENTGP